MIDQEKIVDDIMLNELELKVPGCKEHINNTDSEKKRLGMLSVLGSNYNRDYFEGYRSLIKKEKVCAEYITDIVYVLRNYIEVADTEIKTHGEVMTPLPLVEEMLDTLPKEVWSNPNLKWLDPANGVGTFPSVIVKRLMEGLKDIIQDNCERYQHIVENMIYVVEIQSKNMFLYHCAFDINNTYKLNTYYGSFLSEDFDNHMKNVWGVDKFDIIVGNPPYQKIDSDGDNKLYLLFTQKSINLLSDGGGLIFITPKSIIDYLTNTNKNRKYVSKLYDIKYLSIDDPSKYFSVGSTFLYFYLNNTDYVGPTIIKYVGNDGVSIVEIMLLTNMTIPSKPSDMDINIINKITSLNNNFNFKMMVRKNGGSTVRFRDSEKSIKYNTKCLSQNKDSVFKYPVIQKINKGNPYPGCICYSSEELIDCDKPKVLICRSGYIEPNYDDGLYGITDNMYYYLTKSRIEGDNLIFLLNSPIYKYLEVQFSKSARDKISSVVSKIRFIDLDIGVNITTNDSLYSLYELSEEEIKHIESIIK